VIQFACACGTSLEAPNEAAGKKIQCSRCGKEAIVPAAVPAGPIGDETAALSRLISPEASVERPDTATCDLNATIAHAGAPRYSPRTTHDAQLEGPSVGGYRILRELGQGGMGMMYEAEDIKLERRVSLKVMKPELARDPRHRERFLREACTAASVESPFICPIYEVGEHDGIPFIAMPFLQGEPLDAHWQKSQRLPIEEVVRIGREVAEGLIAAHEAGLVHRDIKPSKIWLEAQASGPPRAVILDFGLARVQADNEQISQSGVIVGTPAYMSPEQARGDKNVDARTDLFSLGCILYALCTGEPPFKGKQMMDVLVALATQEPTPPHTIAATIPLPLSELILRLLAKDPDDRPGTAHAVSDALTAIERAFVAPALGTATAPIKRAARTGRMARSSAEATEPTDLLSPSAVRGTAARKRSYAVYTLIGVGLLGCVISLVGGGIYYFGKAKETIEAPNLVKPAVPAGPEAAQGDRPFNDEDARRIAALPAAQQVEEVKSELMKRNPGFDGKLTPEFADNAVTGLKFATDHIVDISPVRALTRLQSLDMQGVNKASLVDLSPLKGMKLTTLFLDFNPVQDLSPLQGMRLKELDLHGTRVQDLTPLSGMPLEKLMLWAWPGTDLTPLKGMASLKWLNCGGGGRLRDLSPLAGSSLEHLCVNSTEVSDLGPLKSVPLKYLECSNCRIWDLSPLRGMRLEEVNLFKCPLFDVTPLAGMPVHTLDVKGTMVSNLLPLRDMPLKKLSCEFQAKRDAQFLLPIKTLAAINDMPADQFFREFVFAPRLAPMLRGEDKPADDVERLAFAKYAAEQKKFRFAVQLWSEALTNDPRLGDTLLGDDRFFLPKAGDHSGFMASDRDGKWLAVPSADSIALFDARTGELVRTLTGSDRMFALAISPDGNSVAGGNWVEGPQKASYLKLWNLETGQQTLSINSGVGNLWAIRFDADGKRLFGSGPGGVQMWDLSGKLIRTFKASGTNVGLFQIAISPDGKRVVSNDTPTTNNVWEIEGDQPPVTLAGHSQPPDDHYRMSSAYSPNGKLLATGSEQELLLIDAENLKLVKKINTPAGWFAFAPDSQSILTARHVPGPTATDVVTRWDLVTYKGQALPRLSQRTGWFVYHLSPDGKTLYGLVNEERRVRIYDAATGNALFPPQCFADPASSVAFTPGEASVRYHAARAALLAAAGQGEDQPPLYNLGKAIFRRQALDWLNAELTVWSRLFNPGAGRAEHVWIDDDIPRGAKPWSYGSAADQWREEPWKWVTQPQHPVLSGSRAVMLEGDGLRQFFCADAPAGLRVAAGGSLFAYVYLDPARPPKEIMLQWSTGDWMHRAYWGDNLVDWGKDGTTERLRIGPLPEAGKWVRLEVEAARVGINPAMVIRGWAFVQHGGTTYWDRAGSVTEGGPGSPRDVLAALSAWQRDPDLAGVRDAAALAKLPADERNEWQALWARVPDVRPVVPISKEVGQKWRYTTEKPADGWEKADFDDKSWQEGVGGFGGYGKVGTNWKTDDIWLRREFTLPEGTSDKLLVLVNQDDDAEVYVNGVLAYERKGWSAGEYLAVPLSGAARAALQPGKNVLAVHGHNVVEGQYIDAGILAVQNNAARLLYAQMAVDRKQFGLAAALWSKALASDRKLGDDRQARLRYHAARAASLALAGQGTDAPHDGATKVTLCGHALDWLKAELAATTEKQSRLAKVETLWQWQQDSDFAAIREPAELAKLPADEQTACAQFWADIAKMEEPANDAERKEFAQLAGERLMDADAKQFAFYFAKLNAWRQQGLSILTGEIERKPLPPASSDWTVRFYKWNADILTPTGWDAVLKSPVLDELKMPRLHLVELTEPPKPPTPKVPGEYFAVVATTEVTLDGGEYVIRATSDDGVRVWLDNEMVLDDWSIHAPTTRSVSVRNKRGKHLIKVEFFQGTRWYHLEVDVILAEEWLAKRQANAAVALLRLNQADKVWPLLKQSPDPRLRSYLIDRLAPLGADAKAFVEQLEKESDPGVLRALLLSLGEFSEKDYRPEERKALVPKLQEMYRSAADAGLHGAAEWLLRQWKEDAWLKETDQAWAADKEQQMKRLGETMLELTKEPRHSPLATHHSPLTTHHSPHWYVNGQGQTLVVIPGPVDFWMGSPTSEEGRAQDYEVTMELRHWRRIGRSFAVASKEVTVEQFLRFRKDHPISREHAATDDCPANMVSWYDAAAYCNWLSEQEGIPRDQWCYEPNAEGQYAQGMKLAANYLQCTGYRLPTEAEWEFACRAGAVTRYSFGESDDLLERYGWYQKIGQNKMWPVGSLKPNDLGLFDMHGNGWEWCQDAIKPYRSSQDGKAVEAVEESAAINNSSNRAPRGGGWNDAAPVLRSAQRWGTTPALSRQNNLGFRPVRTLPFSAFDCYAAARAAVGRISNPSKLDDAAKAKLRRQALDWLMAELADWRKLQPPRVFIARNLWQWQHDRDLAAIRDQAALAKLPVEEQKTFTQFWADIAKTVEPADSGERLEFARAAVLIAAGMGKDEPAFDNAAKAKLREQALAWLKTELAAATFPASKAAIIAVAAPLQGTLEKLAESAPDDGLYQAELARHFAERGDRNLAGAARSKARAWFEARLAMEPANAALAAELADALLIDTTRWTILKPAEIKSEGGATLTVQPDDSVLASGASPVQDTYTVEVEVDRPVTALRLEVLPDPSLPANGPGRAPNGNFHLRDIRAGPVAGQTPEAAWTWLWAYADFGQGNADAGSIQNAVDDSPTSAWGIWPEVGRPHWAILVPDSQGGEAGRARLTVRLAMGEEKWERTTLGRFRLSVSHDPVAALERERNRFAARKLTDPWAKLAAAYAVEGQNDKAVEYLGKARTWLEAKLAKEPANSALAAELANLLLIDTTRWTVLKPAEAKSELGATLSVLPDNSILASGPNPHFDSYRVVLTVPRDIDLAAVRLEALTHPSLPGNGPGRYEGRPETGHHKGIFAQQCWKVTATPPDPKEPIRLEFDNAWTDLGGPYPIQSQGHWHGSGGEGKNCTAIWSLPRPVSLVAGTTLTFEMKYWGVGAENLGRFRLSVSTDPAVERKQNCPTAMKLTDPWAKLAVGYGVNGRNDKALEYFGKAMERADSRAGKAAVISAAAPLRGLLEKLAESIPNDGRFQAELARSFAERGDNPSADAACDRARAVFEAALAREPANSTGAADLADVLLIQGRARMERSVRLGRENQGNGLDLVDYPLDGAHEPAEIEGQPCRQIETGKRAWGHAYFAIDKEFKWAPNMHVEVEIDYWADRAGWFTIQYDSHNEAYNKSLAHVDFAGSEGWKTARFELKEARFASSQNGGADFRVVVATPGRFCLKRVSVKRLISGAGADDPWAKLVTAYAVNGRNDRAVEWLRRALQADPKLADDRTAQRRYHAARAAALAVAGPAQDQPPRDDAARAQLRRQALDWLNAELTVWTKLFETGPQERANVVAALSAWQQDADLAGVRDATALAKLPADERDEWQALWARVPDIRPVLPTSREVGQRWRYATTQPAEGWQKADFDDKQWQDGNGVFGTWGGAVRTDWKTDDIWLRREFTLAEGNWDDLVLLVNNDDDVEVYINGVLAVKRPYSAGYFEMPISAEARAMLQPGKNVLAVHCHNWGGPQQIDVGIVSLQNSAARVALTQVASDRKQYAFAAQLWADALARDPNLGDDRRTQHRFNAARTAALAAAGLGTGEPALDNAAKVKLRRQALDWLRAELTAWGNPNGTDPAQRRTGAVQALDRWRKVSDLAGIREPGALTQLPVNEQKPFTQLWADVAGLLAKDAEDTLAQRPADLAAADALAGVLLEKAEPAWSTLKPLAVKSEGGATLTLQPDDSVLASGFNPDVDVYVIEAEVQGRIEAIRLEAIPDPSMPVGGSGRAPGWGNFMLTDFRVTAGESVVAWSRAYADFSQTTQWDKPKDLSIANAIDADESTAWAIWPRVAEPHWGVFVPREPIVATGTLRLSIRLAFQSKENKGYALGRFRLSVKEAHTSWVAEATTPHARLGAACLVLGDGRRAVELLTKATLANPKLPAADRLVLALAHARLKETDQALKACAAAAPLLKSSGPDPALRPLLSEVVLAVGSDSATARALIAAAAGDATPAALNEAIQYDPEDALAYRDRGSWFAERVHWKAAIADWTEAYRAAPNTFDGLRLGVLLAHTGDTGRYRAHCRAMLDRWADTEKNFEADQTLKMILLLPDSKVDAKQLARLADVAVSGDKDADWFDYFLFVKGLHEYRTGKYADAMATCRESRLRAPKTKGVVQVLTGLTLTVEAMSAYRSGDKAGARRLLAEAKPHVEACIPGLGGADWTTDWVFTHMLYREADNIIAGKKTGQPQ
jgi:formylglycine-generating enzyme required for sulfatase activity/WD40 repeat protein/tetratricopeptide (TPR) repeat protein/tRNA A-37 threonylcarbamoyl transferase component Bud32